jgi:hypothetical protein
VTYPDDPAANPRQRASTYPPGLLIARLPGEVDTSFCQHEADPPICNCVHDWRIEWGNVSREPKPKATYI